MPEEKVLTTYEIAKDALNGKGDLAKMISRGLVDPRVAVYVEVYEAYVEHQKKGDKALHATMIITDRHGYSERQIFAIIKKMSGY